jgi:hypothetical protein
MPQLILQLKSSQQSNIFRLYQNPLYENESKNISGDKTQLTLVMLI